MPSAPLSDFARSLVLGQAGPLIPMMVILSAAAAAVLGWLLWRARRHHALELEEHANQLSAAREQAQRAEDERRATAQDAAGKAEMLATLSREIRAHLNGVIGSADLLLENSLKSHQRDLVRTLRSSADALHQSVNDVLEYSSIETGRIHLVRAGFELRQPMIEVMESLSPQAALKGLDLVMIIAADVPVQVAGDAERLRQVLHNLLANAVRFTNEGRVVLRVELPKGSAAPATRGGNWLHFSVSDTGPAIPEEMLATFFERVLQTDVSTPRKFGGSGLEMAISRKLVELMGGRIGVRALPEKGSEFWVVLPLAAEAVQPGPAEATPAGLHVVVLDDLAASRVAASAMLTRLGVDHDVTETEAKASALFRDALESGARDLVLLLDEAVARHRGQELARMVAHDSPLRSVRIVLMARQAEPNGSGDHPFPVATVLRKPLLRPDVLLAALRGAPAPATDSRAPFDLSSAAPATGPQVLVVDDDEISRSVSSQLLARLGCVVQVAASGAEAIEWVSHADFALIFMDCQMPEMDGFTTTEKIRAISGGKTPPIVALTANHSVTDRERCFAVGMCDFVGKPARKAELGRALKTWIQPERLMVK